MLSSGLPVKVLVETRDLPEESAVGAGHFAFGVRSVRLAMTAMGLGGVFVAQTPSSNLLSCVRAHCTEASNTADRRSTASIPRERPGGERIAVSIRGCRHRSARSRLSYDPLAGDNLAGTLFARELSAAGSRLAGRSLLNTRTRTGNR